MSGYIYTDMPSEGKEITNQEKKVIKQLLSAVASSATSSVTPLTALAEGLAKVGVKGIQDAVSTLDGAVGDFANIATSPPFN